jgi:hypothetical protein
MSLDEENFPIWRSQLGICPKILFFIDTTSENLIWDAEHIPDENEIFEILPKSMLYIWYETNN